MVLVVGLCFMQDVDFGKYGVFYATSFVVVFVTEGIVINPINVNIDANGIPTQERVTGAYGIIDAKRVVVVIMV